MGNQIYISIILAMGVSLLGFFMGEWGKFGLLIFPLIAFIYMAFNFNVTRSTFNLMWIILILPLGFTFSKNSIFFVIFSIPYSIIYLSFLILFHVQKNKSKNEDDVKNLPKGKLLFILIIGVIIGIALFYLLAWWTFHNF